MAAMNPRTRPADPVEPEVLTAASQILDGSPRQQYALQYDTWQDELWAYTQTVGEFGSVMNWFAAGFGRMHLRAAVWKKDSIAPEFLKEGRAAEMVQELTTRCRGGETEFMRSWAHHLGVPGVGYLVVRDTPSGRWYDVKSADVIRRTARTVPNRHTPDGKPLYIFQIRTGPDLWEDLDPVNSMVGRIYDRDLRFDYLPTSMTKGSLTTLREIDLINRSIIATMLSRVAFNGILFIPSEVTFPVNEKFKQAPDPFIAELLEYASRGIKDPGSPGAAIPFPLRVPAMYIDKFVHLILSTGIDAKVTDLRTAAISRLAEQLPAPPEAMSGISDMNHWNAATQTEENVKLYFAPPVELLCGGLTEEWLHPMLLAEGSPLTDDEGNPIVVWYDSSDLTTDPDNSENATEGVNKGRITEEAWRETTGFSEDSKPTDEERRLIFLRNLAAEGKPISDAYWLLYPEDKKLLDEINPPAPQFAPDGAPIAGPDGKFPAVGKPPADPGNVGPSAGGKKAPTAGKASKEPEAKK